LALGNFDEGLMITNKQLAVEPNNGVLLGTKALALSFLGRRDEVLKIFRKVEQSTYGRQRHNYFGESGRALLYIGEYQKVIDFVEEGIKLDKHMPRLYGLLAVAHYHTGNLTRTNEMITTLQSMVGREVNSPLFYLASVHAQMDSTDLAFEYLEKAYQAHETEMFWLKVEPTFKTLQNDSRWQVILDKVGFPE
jgi:tetratricopeptide (TPR) repeat protein